MTTFVLRPKDLNRLNIAANAIALIGKLSQDRAWEITIEPHVKERTNPQNHALFGVAYPAICAETGFTPDELHEAFCRRFFGTVSRPVFGNMVNRPFRTTTTNEDGKRDVIDAAKFSKFYAMVQDVAAEAGVHVPDPIPNAIRRYDEQEKAA